MYVIIVVVVMRYNRSTISVSLHPRGSVKCVQYSLSRTELRECWATASVTWVHEAGQSIKLSIQ